MNEMNNLINQLSNGIENMNSYEMENYLVRLGVPRSEASAIAINKSTTSPAKANFVPFAQQNNVTPTAAAQFDLNIYRKTKKSRKSRKSRTKIKRTRNYATRMGKTTTNNSSCC